MTGLDFRPLRGSIAIDAIAVADREAPFSNLFELGGTELSIDTLRLLEGRVLIRNLEASDVRWGTPRESSGALERPASAPAAADDKDKTGREGFLQALDIASLVDAQAANLASVKRISEANARLGTVTEKWSTKLATSQAALETLAPRIDEIRGFDYSSISSVKGAQRLGGLVADALPAVRSLTADLGASGRDLAADVRALDVERASRP